MSKHGKQAALVPRLRFPEFRKEPAWNSSRLGDFATILKGKGISKADITSDGALPVIRYAELYTVYDEVIREVVSRTNLDADDLVLSQQGDVIIPASGETKADIATAASVSISGVALGSDLNIIRSHLHGPFFSYYLNGSKRTDIAKVAQGDTVAHLYPGQLEKIIVHYPKTAEQQKIAYCLSSLDDLIAAEGWKLVALREHKIGIMQQLFPREGETRPRIRFPEFQDAPEWAIRKLGDAAQFFNGRAYKKEELLNEGKYRVLRVGNFFSNAEWYFSDLELEESKYANTGDLLYAWSASFGPRIWQGEKVIYHYHIWKVVPKDCVRTDFLYLTLDRETERMKAQSANGLGMLHITKGTIENWECAVPEQVEQQRIAECLSALDAFIAAQAEKLDALRNHKRGLMQQLFPLPEDAGA